jgi:polar amino acid transport system substrate-binding protein
MKKIITLTLALFMITGFAAAETKLTLGTVNWEPYYGENLENGGVLSAVAKAAFKKVGYEIEIQFMDWNRAVGLTKAGKLDGLFGCYYTEERTKVMNISDSIGEAEMVLFSRKGANITFKSLEDLKPYKIGIMRGQVYTKEFDAADFLKKELADKFEVNIKKLLSGRIDLILESKVVLQDFINRNFSQDIAKIEALSPALQSNSIHIGFSKKIDVNDKIVADFNKGLQQIKDEGIYDEIIKKYGF